MPGRNGTGPMGSGAMTGRGLGFCTGTDTVRYGAGAGLGCRRGFGRGFNRNIEMEQTSSKTQKEMLQDQRSLLQSRIDRISKQLESL